jgi:hypothetical protein
LPAGLRLNGEAQRDQHGLRLPEVEGVTAQEELLLNSLVERVNQTQLQEKDPDAEALLNQGLGSNPDAHYILAQTVLVQNIALDQAKAQAAQLQQQLQQAQQQAQQARQQPHATSFLGNLLGHRDPAPPPSPAYGPPQQAYVPPQQTYAPPPPPPGYGAPQYQQPPFAQPQFIPAGQPSFLRGAMQTAAGVAAGALAFEGVEAVLHEIGGHPGYGMGGYGGGGMMPGFDRPMEETVINNYYDQPGGPGSAEHGGIEHSGQDPHLHESADQLPDRDSGDQGGAQLSNANYTTSDDDQTALDSGNTDDQVLDGDLSQDDGSGFDGGGSFDSGGGFDDGGGGGDFS